MVQVSGCHLDIPCINEAKAPTTERKIRELRYAIALEKKFSKDEILERYLNIAYYGDGAYGIESAARHYFDTKASKLNLPQAAMLAGLVQNPDANNPVANLSAAIDRRDVVLNRMVELKLITPDQSKKAKKVKFDEEKVQYTRNGCPGTRYPFLCDYVRRSLENMPELGKTVTDRRNTINRGGLTIETAIDTKTQDYAQKKVNDFVGPKDPLISTMNMIQPGTGLIVASAQSRPKMGKEKGETFWNLSAPTEMGGIQGYQAGSTFKAFTIAAALEKGIPISKKFNAKSPYDFTGKKFQSCRGEETIYGKYKVSNSVGHSKTIAMTEAAEFSVNTYFIQLELAAGMCRVTKMADKLGVKVGHAIGAPAVDIVKEYNDKPSFTLGTAEVSPLSMAEAYATFAARGIHCNPIIISKITTRTGKKVDPPSANCKRVIDSDVADGVNKVLKSVVDKGTGTRAKVPSGHPQAGKTGTIDSNAAVWFAGYTPKIAAVAMVSIDNRAKPFIKGKSGYRKGLKGFRIPSTDRILEGSGSGDSGQYIWKPVMAKYLEDTPKTRFKEPSKKLKTGKMVRVPSIYGMSISSAEKKLRKKGFTVEKTYVYSPARRYSFLGWSPRPGSRVPQFGTIYQRWSKGEDPNKKRREAAEKKAKAAAKKAKKAAAAAARE